MVRTTGRTAGVRVLVDPKKMPDGQKALPEAMEGTKRWRHPVFRSERNPDPPWVTQEPHPYFFKVVDRLGPASRLAVNRVLDGITKDIT